MKPIHSNAIPTSYAAAAALIQPAMPATEEGVRVLALDDITTLRQFAVRCPMAIARGDEAQPWAWAYAIQLYDLDVVTFMPRDPGGHSIQFQTGGFNTTTTKRQINVVSRAHGWRISSQAHKLTVESFVADEHEEQSFPFFEGYTIAESPVHWDSNAIARDGLRGAWVREVPSVSDAPTPAGFEKWWWVRCNKQGRTIYGPTTFEKADKWMQTLIRKGRPADSVSLTSELVAAEKPEHPGFRKEVS